MLNQGNHLPSRHLYFLPNITWSKVSGGQIAFRYKKAGGAFDVAGTSIFGDEDTLQFLMGACNSSVMMKVAEILSPTMNFEVGQIAVYPVIESEDYKERVCSIVDVLRTLSRIDWDAFETSWDFARHPMLPAAKPALLSGTFDTWEAECQERFNQLKANEEELNRIFARIYNMEGEVPIEVPDDKVSVRLADRARDAKSLISYAVGCILGRYSTKVDGLILADAGQNVEDFRRIVAEKLGGELPDGIFLLDEDNILPVLDAEWFDDDIVTSFYRWLEDTYGTESLDANIAWLEESIGTDLRSYFCKDFYADHVRTYQKRPIYWMFSSPKGAFRCLVYMHRYNEGLVGEILTKYLRVYKEKLNARIGVLENSDRARDVKEADKLRAQVAELETWEKDVIYPLAHERIAIDLDDGVKVNYNKFPHALAKVTGLSDWR